MRKVIGGGGGIRTHGPRERTPVFKTGAFNRSATPPGVRIARASYCKARFRSSARHPIRVKGAKSGASAGSGERFMYGFAVITVMHLRGRPQPGRTSPMSRASRLFTVAREVAGERRAGRDAGSRPAGFFASAPDCRRLSLQRVQSQGAYLLPRAVHHGAVSGATAADPAEWFSLVAMLLAHHAGRDRTFDAAKMALGVRVLATARD